MPTYCILGSTGNVGGAVLKVLANSNKATIHAYCRSKQKLIQQNPELDRNNSIQVFEGSLDDNNLLSECFAGCEAIFVTTAVSGNQPGLTIAQDTAHQVVAALEKLKGTHPAQRPPKLIVLSSASTDHRLMSEVPSFLLSTLYRANSYIYDDLKAAENFYWSHSDWLTTIFIKPGALSTDTQRGHEVSLQVAKSPVSYLDLAAGMTEVAEEGGDLYDGKGVAINATSEEVASPWQAPLILIKGLIVHFLPWTYRFLFG